MNGNFSNYKSGTLDIKKYNNDIKFGNDGESKIFNILKNKYGDKIKRTKDRYSKMDFYLINDDNEIIQYFELKNRRIDFGKYPSLCFNKSKLDYAKKTKIKTTILFNCFNGLYKWDYDDNTNDEEYFFGNMANCVRNGNVIDAVFVYNKHITPF
jgi:hypothetical protein